MDLETRLARAVRRYAHLTPARGRATAWIRLGPFEGRHVGFADHPTYDVGLRADVVERALDAVEPGADPPTAWLTRTGVAEPGDVDLAWLAACRAGYARHGMALTAFYVITRTEWADLLGDRPATAVRCGRRPRSPRVDGLVAVHPLAVVQQRQP